MQAKPLHDAATRPQKRPEEGEAGSFEERLRVIQRKLLGRNLRDPDDRERSEEDAENHVSIGVRGRTGEEGQPYLREVASKRYGQRENNHDPFSAIVKDGFSPSDFLNYVTETLVSELINIFIQEFRDRKFPTFKDEINNKGKDDQQDICNQVSLHIDNPGKNQVYPKQVPRST